MQVPDAAYYRKQAETCRRLARISDEPKAKALEKLATEYDMKARAIEA
jgi:hypothetical protein